ncbi:hypothetical protein BDY19DRAFT_994855 [Irpex rosettiformis]|uniref:Uncharacterized protein n=1 Tax=Irpex rosettiformis TaxID=378272 RepID=A0ACB8TZT1_9APHY|nr:hypothetical protein BDY19DRAFT_994855 [Irpex rosettiformis]
MHPSLIVRGSRSAWKGPYFVSFPNLKNAIENNIAIKTEARGSTILPNFVGCVRINTVHAMYPPLTSLLLPLPLFVVELSSARFEVHNGQTYVPIMVTQDMVGHKLGEFAQTRKRFKYRTTKNK